MKKTYDIPTKCKNIQSMFKTSTKSHKSAKKNIVFLYNIVKTIAAGASQKWFASVFPILLICIMLQDLHKKGEHPH